ncbi:MAG: hypothetical protein JW720_15920 [Sedimentisphaerales bacterium]|nr:hypothetical protein [Sedimentisphaerales bacterium]
MVFKRIGFICVSIIICLAGCSRPQKVADTVSAELWQSDYGPGVKLTTAHYHIYTTADDPELLNEAPSFMESAHRGYNKQLPEPIETANKFVIYLFGDRRQWEDFTRSFTGDRAELFCRIKAGAYCHNGVCVAYDIGRRRTLATLGHEGWHQFSSRHFEYRLPSWLDEGVAMQFEHYETRDGRFYFEPSGNTYRLDALAATLAQGRMTRLGDLLAANPGDVLATDQTEAVLAFYSQSYALVRFLREDGYGEWLGDYRRLLYDGLRGDWPLDEVSGRIARDRNEPRTVLWNRIVGISLFEKYIGEDIDKIESRYLSYCRNIVGD